MEEEERTGEERLLAALAHGSIVIAAPAPAVSLLVWFAQRDRSPFTAFQALQAAVYQIAGLLVATSCWICWSLLYTLSLIPIINSASSSDDPPLIFWLGLASMILPFGVMGLWWLYGLIGGIACGMGRDFRYLLLGQWLQRYLDRGQQTGENEQDKLT
jgi:hypothetical protein